MSDDRPHSRTETIVSMVIMLGLAAIAAAVLVKQGRINYQLCGRPGGGDLDTGAEEGTAQADDLAELLRPNLAPVGQSETFDSQTLSDKINGKAETYLQAGFTELRYRRFSSAGDPALAGSAYIYQMHSHAAAFSVYSTQRRAGAVAVDAGDFAYQAQNMLCFVHGPFYAELVGDAVSEDLMASMRAFAMEFVKSTAVQTEPMPELGMFPAEGLEADSVALLMRDVFSFDRLDRVFTARYSVAGQQVTAFISLRQSPEAAAELVAEYVKFLQRLAGQAQTPSAESGPMTLVDVFGSWEVIFTRGPVLAGIHGAEDRQAALMLGSRLLGKLGEEGR